MCVCVRACVRIRTWTIVCQAARFTSDLKEVAAAEETAVDWLWFCTGSAAFGGLDSIQAAGLGTGHEGSVPFVPLR